MADDFASIHSRNTRKLLQSYKRQLELRIMRPVWYKYLDNFRVRQLEKRVRGYNMTGDEVDIYEVDEDWDIPEWVMLI